MVDNSKLNDIHLLNIRMRQNVSLLEDQENQSSSVLDSKPSQPSAVVDEMHKEEQQATGLGVTSEEGADSQLSSGMTNPRALVDKTKSAGDGSKTVTLTQVPMRSHDEISKTIKLDDLSNLMRDVRSHFIDTDSPEDEPIIVTDESEDEEAERYKDTHATSHNEPKDTSLKQQKEMAEAEVAFVKAQPFYYNFNQLTELLVTSLKPELSNLLALHNFGSSIPTELKELPLKITELSGEVKELKKHVQEIEIELPGDLKDIPRNWRHSLPLSPVLPPSTPQTEGEIIKKDKGKEAKSSKEAEEEKTESDYEDHANPADSMVETSKQKKLKNFSFVTKGGEEIHLTAEKIKDQKRIEESLKAELAKQEVKKMKNELVYLIGTDVVTQYYNNKLLYDKYYDKMLKRRKSSKITNCDVLMCGRRRTSTRSFTTP
nr:hypothetical protein [Tanacetum cinerariifolium]